MNGATSGGLISLNGKWAPSGSARLSDADIQRSRRGSSEIVREYGEDPCTLEQACAHEAGHIVVAECIGETILGSRIQSMRWQGRLKWLGCTHRRYGDARDNRPGMNVGTHPELGLRVIINALAGYVGEVVSGHCHPSSSLDERYMATKYGRALDGVLGVSDATSLAVGFDICAFIADQHTQQLDVIRGTLQRNRRLTRTELERMLRQMKPYKDLSDCVEQIRVLSPTRAIAA